MNFKEKIDKYKKKSITAKISDIIFILFLAVMITPSGRLAVGGFVNRIKAGIISPSVKENKNLVQLFDEDYNWELKDINGKKINFEENKGKVIFLNFWATWCPPCVGEMPAIRDLYDDFKNNDKIKFLLVTNDSPQKARDFLKKRNYDFPVYFYYGQLPGKLGHSVIPTTFIISADGKIFVNESGASKWNGEKIHNLLKKLLDKVN